METLDDKCWYTGVHMKGHWIHVASCTWLLHNAPVQNNGENNHQKHIRVVTCHALDFNGHEAYNGYMHKVYDNSHSEVKYILVAFVVPLHV